MKESALHRWSKRKAEGPEEPSIQEETEVESSTPVAEPDSDSEEQQPEEKEEVRLPSLDSLGDESDYSIFMSPEVEENLKKLALRKLFKAPFFNELDGLNDYDEDFTTFETLGNIVTSDMKFREEQKQIQKERFEREAAEKELKDSEAAETLARDEQQPEPTEDDDKQPDSPPSEELADSSVDNSNDDEQTSAV